MTHFQAHEKRAATVAGTNCPGVLRAVDDQTYPDLSNRGKPSRRQIRRCDRCGATVGIRDGTVVFDQGGCDPSYGDMAYESDAFDDVCGEAEIDLLS